MRREQRPPALVSFVGAGPGDPELITVKGLHRLRQADVVIHDRLIPRTLLDETRPGAEIVDVGKAPGCHGMAQDDINALIVERARRGGRVVRLKGGDPAIFARLAEETAAVRAAGIPFEIVPGVTAAAAAAAGTGVSLTQRERTSMVLFATGACHGNGGVPPLDWDLLARLPGTLVFYMPVRSLASIVGRLTALGRDAREPAMLVERIGMEGERVLSSPLGDVAHAARRAGMSSPAILIVGAAVGGPSVPSEARNALALAGR